MVLGTIPHKVGEVSYELRPYYGIKIFESQNEEKKYVAGLILEDVHGPHGYLIMDDEMLSGVIKNLKALQEALRIKNTW